MNRFINKVDLVLLCENKETYLQFLLNEVEKVSNVRHENFFLG